MKLAYFDCTFGAAGDMLLAALIGAGANIEEVNRQLGGLAIEPDAIDLTVEEVLRCSLSSSKLTVNCRHAASVESANGHDGARINGSDSGNSHDHGHEHEHDNELESEQAHDHSRKHERFKEKAEHANDHSHRHDQDHGHG
ncbi:MAG: DUF111 family protein, partial [Candidatus Obscuribacterales bacterium]|nr:DUF111 family protein [Candidatus Obscuribacterales bacterium]